MHRFEKLTFPAVTSITELPSAWLALHTVDCPQCRFRHPVPTEYTDWKAVAAFYEDAYKKMAAAFFSKLEEAGNTFNVPLVEYFDVDRQILLAELRAVFGQTGERS